LLIHEGYRAAAAVMRISTDHFVTLREERAIDE